MDRRKGRESRSADPDRMVSRALRPADIAIIGMSAIMPGAPDVRSYWENILDKIGAIQEVPHDRWPAERYFDGDRDAPDKINSKWGGFIPDTLFDPARFGIPPASVPSIDPGQFLALLAAEAALKDAGLAAMPAELRARASVILGFTGGLGELGVQYAARSELARALPAAPQETLEFLPSWTSDSFSGLLPNVVAGRIANRFDLGGANFVVDAACAASLAALRQAVMELEAGRSDIVLCGAVESGQGPFAFMCFSKAQALSPSGKCQAFDAQADGTAISEGIAMLVLRRLEDAQAAGDRIYAVIKGVDGSSDGRARGMMAPLPEGQKRALRRSYDQAGYSPATVDLFEAHGTGTVVGDGAELESLSGLLLEQGAKPCSAAVGSVKALIGHTKGAAGLAGLLKVALGLYHRVLPPHAGVAQPNEALRQPNCPLALYQQARPWLARDGSPRRAGVSAFGFGGANFHVTLEEHGERAGGGAVRDRWPAELFVWRAADRSKLRTAAAATSSALKAGEGGTLAGLARALWSDLGDGQATLAIVAKSSAELADLLGRALDHLGGSGPSRPLPQGVYLSDAPLASAGGVAMLFPGQGSQYPDMARELAVTFEEVAAVLEQADAVVLDTPTYRERPDGRLSSLVYPPERFGDDEEQQARRRLAATDAAQPALGAVEAAMLELTNRLAIRPDMVAGHSYGEYVALHAAGVLTRRDLFRISEARGRCIVDATRGGDLGTMAAASAAAAAVRGAVGASDVVVANINAPNQTVISGAREAVAGASERLEAAGIEVTRIPVSAAFHSPLMQPAQAPLVQFFDEIGWAAPSIPVYANTTTMPHDVEPARIRSVLGRHLTEPVDFVGMIEAMYAAGARVFLEVGPKTVLASLTRRILGDRPHCAVSLDGLGGGIAGLLHALATLMVQGVRVDLGRLFEGRSVAAHSADIRQSGPNGAGAGQRSGLFLINGTRARPVDGAVRTAVEAISPRPQNEAEPDRGAAAQAAPPRTRPLKEIGMHGYYGPARAEDIDPPPATAAERTMAEHHQTMRQFLQMEERVMLAYLNGGERTARPFSTPRPVPSVVRPAIARPAPAVPSSPPALAERPTAPQPVAPPVERPAPPPPSAVSAPADPQAVLLKIAAERTGYPQEMLGLDLNMEADLGIDSIKRVEILAAFRKAQPPAVSEYLKPRMAQIAKAKTLQQVLDGLRASLLEMPGADRPFDHAGGGRAAAPLARYVMRSAAEDLPGGQPTSVPAGIYIIVPDGRGIATELASLLERDGARVRVAPLDVMANDEAITNWLASVREAGRIRGVIGLASAMPAEGGLRQVAEWRTGMDTAIKSLFPLLRFAAADLERDGIVAVASVMGGEFGRNILSGEGEASFFAGAGGGVGLVKCLAAEWPGCRCKAIDLDPKESAARHAAHIRAEIAAPTGRREVGYPAGRRTIFRTAPAPLPLQGKPLIVPPGSDWVVLAIGGARGITAETCLPFAAAGCVCVVVGRSAAPEAESPATAALPDAAALRHFFLTEAAAAKASLTPAKIEARIAAVLRDREIRANFAAFGNRLDYRVCDVREEADVAALLESLYTRYGRIDAVLFGAGLIEDRLIVDKTRESLSRVFDTKVDGAFYLARHLRPQSLKFLALFTSVAGRYGNRGQTDYGAANEVLNRFAWQLQAQFGAGVKVTAVNWGAWARTTNGPGMLTPETARQFRERGLRLIEPDEGRDFLWNELLHAPRGEVEVVAGEHAWDELEAEAARGSAQPGATRLAVA